MSPRRIPGPAELAGRGQQWLAASADRLGVLPWGTATAPGGASSLRPVLPFPTLTPTAAAALDTAAIVARADLVLHGRYPLLGLPAASPPRTLDWGQSPNWHTDILAGRTAPRAHWSRVPYLNEAVVGDHKVTWELNRLQWLLWLAQAERVTGEARYGQALWQHVANWHRDNPRGQGINWASSLEVAFRAMALTWALHLAPSAPPAALVPALATSLHHHGRHIERWLSTWFSPNTHLTGEALGLLLLGVAFPWLPRAAAWRTLGWRLLVQEAPVQIRPDGTYFEQTGWYQAYTADFYLLALHLAKGAGLPVPALVAERTRAAAAALHAMTRRDGRVVRWGDDDGGRLLPLATGAYGDVRDTLALAAVTCGDAALLPPATGAPEHTTPGNPTPHLVAWLLGDAGLGALRALTPTSAAPNVYLPDGGWCALRTPQLEAFVRAGPHSALSGAHAHADALSLEVTANGRCVLADPGTFRYMGEGRDQFRATAAHNTLVVGERSSAQPAGPFRWASAPVTTVLEADLARDAAQGPALHAMHTGYATLATAGPGLVHREVRRLAPEGLLVIDRVHGRFGHPATLCWRPPAGVRAQLVDERILLVAEHGMSAALTGHAPEGADGAARAPVLATIVIPADWRATTSVSGYSAGYAERTEVVGAVCRAAGGDDIACCTLIWPGLAPAVVRIERRAGMTPAWRVMLPDREFVVTTSPFR